MQLVYFSVFVAVINVGVCQQCYSDWVQFHDRCYGYGRPFVSWARAQAICQAQDARLTEITTLADNNFLLTLVRNYTGGCVWLGGTDLFQERVWEWSSRRSAFKTFSDWMRGQPDNYKNEEDCLAMSRKFDYKWNDGKCTSGCSFICERPATYSEAP